MTSSSGNIFRVTGHFCGEFTGQWRGALMFSLICVWINDWVNNREAGDLRRYRAHYDVIVLNSANTLAKWTSLWHAKLTPRTSSGHCMSIIISFIHITNIGGLMQGWLISVILEKTAVSFCIEPSICCFTLPCIKHIFSGIILCYVMYVASSSISFASLLTTSSDTEKCVKLYVHAMLIVSFEK